MSSSPQNQQQSQPQQQHDVPKMMRSKTTLGVKVSAPPNKTRPGTSVIVRRRMQFQGEVICSYIFFLSTLLKL